jgi:two-component system chemotaxis sensor kinase CheA
VDLAKYRTLFVEDATEHLAEISRRLIELEKTPDAGDAIDEIFRMAHSIKGMAASLGYDPITAAAHRLEDRMQGIRSAGRVPDGDELAGLFRGLEELEALVAGVRETGALPPAAAGLAAPAGPPAGAGSAPEIRKKKAPSA